jgi:formylmethanofuran dehydrogenase subunit E
MENDTTVVTANVDSAKYTVGVNCAICGEVVPIDDDKFLIGMRLCPTCTKKLKKLIDEVPDE